MFEWPATEECTTYALFWLLKNSKSWQKKKVEKHWNKQKQNKKKTDRKSVKMFVQECVPPSVLKVYNESIASEVLKDTNKLKST